MNPAGDPSAAASAFDDDTAARMDGSGAFIGNVTERWHSLGGGPNGGYLLALCMRALDATMQHPDPLVLSAFYLRPGVAGRAKVQILPVRSGRRVGTAEARLVQQGKERVRVVSTFTDFEHATGRTALLASPPSLPPPEECIDPLAGRSIEGVTLSDQVEYRYPEPPGWWTGKPSGIPSSELWVRFTDGRDPDLLSLPLFVDAAAPVVLELGEVGSTTLELTLHIRARPAPGWLSCRITTRFLTGGFHEEDFEVWDSRDRLVAQARQLAIIPASQDTNSHEIA